MDTIFRRYFLPSSLSKYDSITLPSSSLQQSSASASDEDTVDAVSLGVHFLKFQNAIHAPALDALYVNHGFGASSLSWLPALPKLTRRIRSRVGLGHDAVGFGFTERPDQDELFRTGSSASIGMALLDKHAGVTGGGSPFVGDRNESEVAGGGDYDRNMGESFVMVPSNDEKPKQSVALIGHSLGSWATLDMALRMPEGTRQLVILVAPAVVLDVSKKSKSGWNLPPSLEKVQQAFTRNCVYPVAGYMLRRLVG